MAEGFYRAADNPILSPGLRFASESVLTIFTGRALHYKRCETEAEADEWSGLKMGPTGEDIYQWGLNKQIRTSVGKTVQFYHLTASRLRV